MFGTVELSLNPPFTFTLQDNTATTQTAQVKDSNKWQQWQLFCCSSQSVSVAAAVFCYVVKQTQDVVRLHRNILHDDVAYIGKPNNNE